MDIVVCFSPIIILCHRPQYLFELRVVSNKCKCISVLVPSAVIFELFLTLLLTETETGGGGGGGGGHMSPGACVGMTGRHLCMQTHPVQNLCCDVIRPRITHVYVNKCCISCSEWLASQVSQTPVILVNFDYPKACTFST